MPIPPNAWSTLKEGLLFDDRYGKKLGFETTSPTCFFEREDSRNSIDEEVVAKFKSAVDVDINALVQQRLEAKQNKDYT